MKGKISKLVRGILREHPNKTPAEIADRIAGLTHRESARWRQAEREAARLASASACRIHTMAAAPRGRLAPIGEALRRLAVTAWRREREETT